MNMLTYLKHPYMTTFTYIFVAIYLVYSSILKNNIRAIGIVFLLGVCIVKFIPIKWHSYKLLWAIAIIGIAEYTSQLSWFEGFQVSKEYDCADAKILYEKQIDTKNIVIDSLNSQISSLTTEKKRLNDDTQTMKEQTERLQNKLRECNSVRDAIGQQTKSFKK